MTTYTSKDSDVNGSAIAVVAIIVAIIIGFIAFMMWGVPQYRIYNQEMRGKAALREAEWSRQIMIKEAEARLASETLNAKAEVERAKGVSEANIIVAEGLGGAEGYLRYLYINAIKEANQIGNSSFIYIPTEAGIPILEAGRFK
jgi:hypothetical protein